MEIKIKVSFEGVLKERQKSEIIDVFPTDGQKKAWLKRIDEMLPKYFDRGFDSNIIKITVEMEKEVSNG
jgi:hypothetical protein